MLNINKAGTAVKTLCLVRIMNGLPYGAVYYGVKTPVYDIVYRELFEATLITA